MTEITCPLCHSEVYAQFCMDTTCSCRFEYAHSYKPKQPDLTKLREAYNKLGTTFISMGRRQGKTTIFDLIYAVKEVLGE